MSGGSFEYLCFKDVEQLFNCKQYLGEMADFLTSQGCDDAGEETERLLAYIEHAVRQVEARRERLEKVWHDAEWWQSGDIGESDFRNTMKEYQDK